LAAKKNFKPKNPDQQPKKKTATVRDKDVIVEEDNIVEVDETRQPASLVFIGHVDAGKSTISGQIMYLMGVVDQRTI
jgi:peptide chain release factor subunit 3